MKKITKKWQLVLYACSGLGVNLLNMIVGSYLCSALLVGGFDESDIGFWTYGDKDLVIAALWGGLIIAAKILDGVIDIPMSHFIDNLKTRFGRRRPGILIGFIPMIFAFLMFLVPLNWETGILNTIWFAFWLMVFYGCYTLTMLTFYATFAEIVGKQEDIVFISNIKSVCDVVYFSLSFALVPVFVSMGMNIRIVALLFLPLSLTMMIPMIMLKEEPLNKDSKVEAENRPSLIKSVVFAFQDKAFIIWLAVLCTMNIGLQLFLGGINEYFSTTGLNMTVVMACCFAPVPFTIILYNKIVKKFGLGIGYRYIVTVFSAGMLLMGFVRFIPASIIYPYAIMCSLIVSFAIGAFFAVTYVVPSNRAAARMEEHEAASSMYFAIQGLFEAASAGVATGAVLVFLKQSGNVQYMTLIVAGFGALAFAFSFFLPKAITAIGKPEKKEEDK